MAYISLSEIQTARRGKLARSSTWQGPGNTIPRGRCGLDHGLAWSAACPSRDRKLHCGNSPDSATSQEACPTGRQGFPASPARRSLRVDCALTPELRSPLRSQALLHPGEQHH